MRIGMITEQLHVTSGTPIHVCSLSKALSLAGHEVHIVSLGELNNSLDIGNATHHSAGQLPSHILDGNTTAQALIDTLITVSQKYELELIHSHYPAATMACALNRAINSIPYVTTLHGYELQLFLMRDFQYYAAQIGFSQASTIISVSNAMAEEFRRVMQTQDTPMDIVPDGVDMNPKPGGRDLVRKALNIEDSFVYLFIGRLTFEKGVSELLHAFLTVTSQINNCHLIIIGKGHMEGEIDSFIKNNNLDEKITMAGEVEHSAIADYYAAADLFVLPSYNESLGTVILESLRCGTPVLATRVGGIPEIVEEEKNGLLVPVKDTNALTNSMLLVAKDKDYFNQLKIGASQQITKYDWKYLCNSIIEIYKRVITEKDSKKEMILNKLQKNYSYSGKDVKSTPWEGKVWQFGDK